MPHVIAPEELLSPFREIPGDVFSSALWDTLGRWGLLGWTLPRAAGGQGRDTPSFLHYLARCVALGMPAGMGLGWCIHLVISRHLLLPLAPHLGEALLPRAASGEVSVALAVSEPGVGAHPARLQSRAWEKDGTWTLEGTKTPVSNGTFASHFLVVAQTGRDGSKKAFTAFLVPRDAPRLEVESGPNFPFLRSCPHATMHLRGTPVPASSLVGTPGRAYEEVIRPFRDLEDVGLSAVLVGCLRRCLNRLGADADPGDRDADRMTRAGRILCCLESMEVLMERAGSAVDKEEPVRKIRLFLGGLRHLGAAALAELESWAGAGPSTAAHPESSLADARAILRLASHVNELKKKKLGEEWFRRLEEENPFQS
ncbi:Acyl-CoA dehydrogenase [Desulfacinum infernum DSM 9756]|uniref:Acyl-CoA dehydrogenase n=1 Tax=Desulfacinum infernum DSM 9756 TaxID=1121391 RepID=A0A1M5BF50_9BACT|nr:acyl-CoA dehydrogenase [Desulfacinum infernum]SHF40977.1 Acyl-CoA dehydrogenase [Desulfacinum infernum DSM 9756]